MTKQAIIKESTGERVYNNKSENVNPNKNEKKNTSSTIAAGITNIVSPTNPRLVTSNTGEKIEYLEVPMKKNVATNNTIASMYVNFLGIGRKPSSANGMLKLKFPTLLKTRENIMPSVARMPRTKNVSAFSCNGK